VIREYFVRGERKTVEEIDDVVAVRVADGATVESVEARPDDDELSAFRSANWVFLPESSARVLETADDSGKLVQRPNGRFGIVTKRLTVQLDKDLPTEEAGGQES
jgi:hypothetical protein